MIIEIESGDAVETLCNIHFTTVEAQVNRVGFINQQLCRYCHLLLYGNKPLADTLSRSVYHYFYRLLFSRYAVCFLV